MRTFHLAPAYDNTKRIDEVFMPDIRYAQNENVDRGDLRMQVIERGTSTPIDDAKISISYSGDPDSTVEEVNTDASGIIHCTSAKAAIRGTIIYSTCSGVPIYSVQTFA